MKYGMMPRVMWLLFHGSFERALETELHQEDGKEIMRKAHKHYKEILADVDEFDSRDCFLVNILSCAMFSGVYLSLPEKPDVAAMTRFYSTAMDVPAMCRYDYDMAQMSGTVFTRKFTLAFGGPCCDCHYHHIQ